MPPEPVEADVAVQVGESLVHRQPELLCSIKSLRFTCPSQDNRNSMNSRRCATPQRSSDLSLSTSHSRLGAYDYYARPFLCCLHASRESYRVQSKTCVISGVCSDTRGGLEKNHSANAGVQIRATPRHACKYRNHMRGHAFDETSTDLVGSERVHRHPHRRTRSAPQCGVSRGPRACRELGSEWPSVSVWANLARSSSVNFLLYFSMACLRTRQNPKARPERYQW